MPPAPESTVPLELELLLVPDTLEEPDDRELATDVVVELPPELVPDVLPVVATEVVPEVPSEVPVEVVAELPSELDPWFTAEEAPVFPWSPDEGPPPLVELQAPTRAAIPTNEIGRAIILAPSPSFPSQWMAKRASFHFLSPSHFPSSRVDSTNDTVQPSTTAPAARHSTKEPRWYGCGRNLVPKELDRVAPSRRAACRTRQTGRQTWRDLLFLHWEVPVDVLRQLVPATLTIDVFEGRAYVGLVPFTMHDVRIGPLPVADFLETNLRTYVHAGGVPGVWFFSLDAQRALAVWGGRTFYRLPYFRADMSCAKEGALWQYRLRRSGGDVDLDAQWSLIEEAPHAADAGTLEHFLTERYALYGPTRGNGVYRLRVHHAPWPLQRARLHGLVTTIPSAAKVSVGDPLDLVLASAQGVAVKTFATERI